MAIAVLCTVVLGASAQEDYETPSDELSVSWGLGSGPMFVDAFSSVLLGGVNYEMQTGSVSAQYMHNFNKRVGVGLAATYEGLKSQKPIITDEYLSSSYVSIMPTARLFWFRKSMFGMYSRVAAGVTINNFDYLNEQDGKSSKESKTEVGFAFQASPIGIELGTNKVCGFLEGGFGFQGMVIAGVRFGL